MTEPPDFDFDFDAAIPTSPGEDLAAKVKESRARPIVTPPGQPGAGYVTFPGGRPNYETKDSVRDEIELATIVASHLGMDRLWKLNPRSYGLDFALRSAQPDKNAQRNDIVLALLEVKRRNRVYDTWLISALKMDRAASFERAGLGSWFAWGVLNGNEWEVHLWDYRPVSTFILAGRTDRNDPDDIEPMAVVPAKACETFSALRPPALLAARDSFSL